VLGKLGYSGGWKKMAGIAKVLRRPVSNGERVGKGCIADVYVAAFSARTFTKIPGPFMM